jgi:hypothetical protein
VTRALVPFASAAEAWVWTMQALIARRDGARIVANRGEMPRPCEPDDVIRCLDRLYRQRRITPEHARALRVGAERLIAGAAPVRTAAEKVLWDHALRVLREPLLAKGIVQ